MKPYQDLRSFAHALEITGRLRRVHAAVDKDWELAGIARWVMECTAEPDRFALQFEHIQGYDTPVIVGLYASRALYAQALQVKTDAILARWAQALRQPQQPVITTSAPVMTAVHTTAAINLLTLPVPVWTPGRDGGPYLTAASVITRDPETGIQNMGVYRVQMHNAHTTGLFFGTETQHGALHYAKYGRRDEPMPVALVIGGPPHVHFAAAAKTAYGTDELEIAGGLAGEGIEVVRGATVDLLVPAHAEMVIEGFVSPQQRLPEGPFGEGLGYMNLVNWAPVIDVTAICHRENPVYHGYVQQLPPSEGHLVWEMGVLGPLWFYLTEKMGLRGVCDLAVVRGSAGIGMIAIQVKLGAAALVQKIKTVLSAINFGQRFILIVDEDVDIHDLESLQWALTSRVDPARDVTTVGNVNTYQLDPAVLASLVDAPNQAPPYSSTMMIINATTKTDTPEIALPGAGTMQKVWDRWSAYGLPDITPRPRLTRLLKHHSANGIYFNLPHDR